MAIKPIKFYKKTYCSGKIPWAFKFWFSTILLTIVLWPSFSKKQVNPIFDVWYVSWVCAKVSALKIGSGAAGTKGLKKLLHQKNLHYCLPLSPPLWIFRLSNASGLISTTIKNFLPIMFGPLSVKKMVWPFMLWWSLAWLLKFYSESLPSCCEKRRVRPSIDLTTSTLRCLTIVLSK